MSEELQVNIDMRALIKAGAHFGHRKRFRHPSYMDYLFELRNGVHIINLDETKRGLIEAAKLCYSVAASGKKVMLVCTRQAGSEFTKQEALRCGMPYVNHRWLGGLLSNHDTVLKSVRKLQDYEEMSQPEKLRNITKKEGLRLLSKLRKLKLNLDGLRELDGLPAALFVIDVGHHRIAVREARKMGIPVVAVVDSNHSTEDIDIVIPGNDDSPHSIKIYMQVIADALIEGKKNINTSSKEATQKNGSKA